ncbi:hypothetical protein EJB05_44651, partial [Eragrostis curvula]
MAGSTSHRIPNLDDSLSTAGTVVTRFRLLPIHRPLPSVASSLLLPFTAAGSTTSSATNDCSCRSPQSSSTPTSGGAASLDASGAQPRPVSRRSLSFLAARAAQVPLIGREVQSPATDLRHHHERSNERTYSATPTHADPSILSKTNPMPDSMVPNMLSPDGGSFTAALS